MDNIRTNRTADSRVRGRKDLREVHARQLLHQVQEALTRSHVDGAHETGRDMQLLILRKKLLIAICLAGSAAYAGGISDAIGLRDARRSNLCEVVSAKDVPFNSRFVEIALAPKTGNKELIRIEPGWLLKATDGAGSFVTVLPAEVRLLARNNAAVKVFAVEVERFPRSGVMCEMAELAGDDPMARLVGAGHAMQPVPEWNDFQVATWIMRKNPDLKALRRERYSAPRQALDVVVFGEEGARVATDAGTIDRALLMLKNAGEDLSRFRITAELESTLAAALAQYRERKRDLQALDTLGFYRNRPEAFAVLSSVWKERAGDKPPIRKTALRWLSGMWVHTAGQAPVIDPRVIEVLKAARTIEPDPAFQKEIDRFLARAGK